MSSKSAKAKDRAEKAAIAFAEAKRKQRRRNILSGVAVAAAIALIVGGGVLINVLRQNNSDQDFEARVPVTTDYSLVVGDADAPHKLVIYEDFLCPICGELEATAGDDLNALVEQGQVQIDYRPISILSRFGPYSDDALNAFFVVREEAGDDVAKKFHDLLYADQPAEDSSSWPDSDWFVEKAVEAGATEDQVADGIENGAQDDAISAATDDATNKAGVTGTPTILVDGKVYTGGFDDLAAAVSK